jgi:hypothetical protein
MALLAYLVMVASLMTAAFIGFEWVATTSPKAMAHLSSPKSAVVIEKRRAYLAALQNPENPETVADKGSEHAAITADASQADSQPQDSQQHQIRAHRRVKIAVRRQRDAAGQTAQGYGFEPNPIFGSWRDDIH